VKHSFITIEGCIGAGKTTLSTMLAHDYSGKLILERFEDNPFLPLFYADPHRHAFPVELYFMAERFQQLKALLSETDLFASFTVSDFLFQKSLIFATNNLSENEAKLYRTLFDIINPNLPKPELILYLYAPVDKLLDNIHLRGRSFEQKIEASYLQNIQTAYLDYFKYQKDQRIILLDTTDLDFTKNPSDYARIYDLLQGDYPIGITYL
jgi:deoxyguanosine kinase